MVTTATRARTNSRGDKSMPRGGAGKGGGGILNMVGAFSMMEKSGIRCGYGFFLFLFFFPFFSSF